MDSDELREVYCDDGCQDVRWKAADELDRLTAEVRNAFMAGFEAGYESDGLYRQSNPGSTSGQPVYLGDEAFEAWLTVSGTQLTKNPVTPEDIEASRIPLPGDAWPDAPESDKDNDD